MSFASVVQSTLNYDRETGVFTRVKTGRVTGYKHPTLGYVQIGIGDKLYYAHRLAWLIMTGEWPTSVDHIDGDRSNNAWSNLRHAQPNEQNQNMAMRADNTTGFKGVFRARTKFAAQIQKDGKRYCLGSYETPDEAYAAYLAAKSDLHTFNPIPRYELAER